RRIAEGECVIDPTIVKQLLHKHRDAGPLDTLTEREREVLAAMAEGHSNDAIARALPRTQNRGSQHPPPAAKARHHRVTRQQPARTGGSDLPSLRVTATRGIAVTGRALTAPGDAPARNRTSARGLGNLGSASPSSW